MRYRDVTDRGATMADRSTADDLEKLRSRACVSDYAVMLARGVWQERRSALESGLVKSRIEPTPDLQQYVRHQDRYLCVARYCDEARELLSQYKSDEFGNSGNSNDTDDKSIREVDSIHHGTKRLIAIDPHVISAYCEFWNPNSHKGFDFIENEFDSAEHQHQYRLFVYASLLTGGPLALLDAARPDIQKMVAFFFEDKNQDPNSKPITPENLLAELKRTSFASSIEPNPKKRLEFIHKKAVELASVKADAAARQALSLARLNHVMRAGAFFVPEALVSKAWNGDGPDGNDERAARFSNLVRAVRTSAQFSNESFQSFVRAYEAFRASVDVPASEWGRNQLRPIRGGELSDLAIIHELNVLNHALRLCGIDAEFVYVTLSTRMYDFLSGFSKNDVLTPIMHPRTAIVFRENQLARAHGNALETALASPIAFGKGIPNGGEILPSEIDDFNQRMSSALRATRDAFSYSVVAKFDSVDQFFRTFEHIFKNAESKTVQNEYQSIIKSLKDGLPKTVTRIGMAYADAAEEDLFEDTFIAYQQFSSKELAKQFAYIRKFQPNGSVTRYAAIPITQGYRHMFFLHNNFIDRALRDHISIDTIRVSIHDLLDVIMRAVEEEIRTSHGDAFRLANASAVRFFGRSCYAACSGEWNLVLSLTSGGLRKLRDHLPATASGADTPEQAQGHLLAQELHFLRHLAERALAEAAAPAGMHGSRLVRSAAALLESSRVSAMLPEPFAPFKTQYSATSVRDALAAIGLLIEWQMKDAWRHAHTRDRALTAILCPTVNERVAWHGLDVLVTGLKRDDGDNWSKLLGACDQMVDRVDVCYQQTVDKSALGHSTEMWRYLLLRAHAMRMTALQGKNILEKTEYSGQGPVVTARVVELRNEHYGFIEACSKPSNVGLDEDQTGKTARAGYNPFLDGLLAVEAFVAAAPIQGDSHQISNLPKAMRAFADLDEKCSELARFGFPRMFLRKAKEQLVGPIIDSLRATYQPAAKLDEDSRIAPGE